MPIAPVSPDMKCPHCRVALDAVLPAKSEQYGGAVQRWVVVCTACHGLCNLTVSVTRRRLRKERLL